MAAKGGLGIGLSALFDDNTTDSAASQTLRLSEIEPNRSQPRKKFDDESISALADSIKRHGILQPLLVRPYGSGYQIVAGERRWRAARMLGMTEVPVQIREFSDSESMQIALIENLQRENLNPIEEAQAYKRLLTEFHLKQDEVAERVSKSRAAVTNSIRLLKLNEEVQRMVVDEMISTGHARALLAVENPEEQYNLAQRIFDEKLSVRDVEKLVKNLHKPAKSKKVDDKTMQVIYQDIEEKLKQKLGRKVTVTSKGEGSGKIEIEFYNHEDLDRLLDVLNK